MGDVAAHRRAGRRLCALDPLAAHLGKPAPRWTPPEKCYRTLDRELLYARTATPRLIRWESTSKRLCRRLQRRAQRRDLGALLASVSHDDALERVALLATARWDPRRARALDPMRWHDATWGNRFSSPSFSRTRFPLAVVGWWLPAHCFLRRVGQLSRRPTFTRRLASLRARLASQTLTLPEAARARRWLRWVGWLCDASP